MHTLSICKYFILFNVLATLSQHLPFPSNKRMATIIVSSTEMQMHTQAKMTTTATATTKVNKSDFAEALTATTTTTAPRTTSASVFVDEVLPHNDSVANTLTLLHAKAIDSDNNSNNSYNNKNTNIYNNNNAVDFEQLLENKLQEEQKATGTSETATRTRAVDDAGAGIWDGDDDDGDDDGDGFTPPDHQRLLSRKRRYLIFPEGSSFQLVYDGIFGIVDYTNYLILGITVALAWELPSEPQGEVIEEIASRLRGDRPELRRNDTEADITFVNTKNNQAAAATTIKHSQPQVVQSSRPNYINLLTTTSPATSPATNMYDPTKAHRPPTAFHPPMHQKYYIHSDNNKYGYNNKKYIVQRRPTNYSYYSYRPEMASHIGGYYKAHASDWRRKYNYYYKRNNKNKNHNKNFELSTLKVNPFNKWTTQRHYPSSVPARSYKPQAQGTAGQYPWWNLKSRLSNSLRRKPIPSRRIDNGRNHPMQKQQQQQHHQQQQQQQQQRHGKSARLQQQQEEEGAASGFYRQPPATARKHRIYPVFGKRSITDEHRHPTAPTTKSTATATNTNTNNNKFSNNSSQPNHNTNQTHQRRYRRSGIVNSKLSHIECIHIRHHRSTRQALYEKIEKYLDKLDIKHSHQCILRALCETGQKSKERNPGTFVAEIMRAVFTIPEALEADMLQNRIHYKHQRYDRAIAFEGNCAKEYALCEQSLWETQFVK